MTLAQRPFVLSFSLHTAAALAVLAVSVLKFETKTTRAVNLDVIVAPKLAPAKVQLQPRAAPPKPQQPEPPKAIFGLSRQAFTAADPSAGVEVKAGNTVAKEQDNLKLNADDPTSLPIPTDEFLVTAMPRLKSEYRIPYPVSAKKAGVEGPVVMELLIDSQGQVRQATLLSGPGFGLNEAALEAVKRFEFTPAQVQNENVAVKIRYTYRFVLEGA
jgi:protein TonB